MRKFFAAFCALALLVPAVAFAASEADVRAAVERTIAKGAGSGGITKIVDVYGGKGVISSKDALWWVKDGKVFVVNGTASSVSPDAPKAPPSVTAGKIHSAAEGSALPLPAHLGLTGEELAARVENTIKEITEKEASFKNAVLKKETYFEYSLNDGKDTAAQFSFKECGGLVTAIDMSGYATVKGQDKKTALTGVLTIAVLRAIIPSKEARQPFVELMIKNDKGGTKTSANLTMTFKRSKSILEMSLVPTSGENKTEAKGKTDTAVFKLTPKVFVANYNKSAKFAKSDQRARLGSSNETSVRVTVSKHNGVLLGVNAVGNVTSVTYMGTGDGALESAADILLGLRFAIAGVKPDWSPKQCFDVLKNLGFGTSNTLPEKASVAVDDVLFELRFSQGVGIWLIMTPYNSVGFVTN